jgi:hypothetical protein
MTIGEMAAADLRNMIADAPVEFTFNGLVFVGTCSGKSFRRPLEMGGFEDEPDVTLVTPLKTPERAPVFGIAPAVGDYILIGQTTYKVDRTELDEFSESLQLDLRSAKK